MAETRARSLTVRNFCTIYVYNVSESHSIFHGIVKALAGGHVLQELAYKPRYAGSY